MKKLEGSKQDEKNDNRIPFKFWAILVVLFVVGPLIELFLLQGNRIMRYVNSMILMTTVSFISYEMWPDLKKLFFEVKEVLKEIKEKIKKR